MRRREISLYYAKVGAVSFTAHTSPSAAVVPGRETSAAPVARTVAEYPRIVFISSTDWRQHLRLVGLSTSSSEAA